MQCTVNRTGEQQYFSPSQVICLARDIPCPHNTVPAQAKELFTALQGTFLCTSESHPEERVCSHSVKGLESRYATENPFELPGSLPKRFFQIQDKLVLSYRCKICSTISALSCKLQNLDKLHPLVLLFWKSPDFGATGNETETIELLCYPYPNKNLHPTGIFQYNHNCSRPCPSQGQLPTRSRCSMFFTGLFGDSLNTVGG